MKTLMYICENLVSTCPYSIMKYFHALGDYSTKVITPKEVDFYLTNNTDPYVLPYDMIELFISKGLSTEGLKAVYTPKDTRLSHIFGIYKIPNRIVIGKELQSYIEISYNASTDTFTAKRYHLDKLTSQSEYENNPEQFLVKETYFLWGKLKPFELSIEKSEDESKVYLNYTFEGLKNSEYNHYTIDFGNSEVSYEIRRVYGKDCFGISKDSKTYTLEECIMKQPSFDFMRFQKGQMTHFHI